MARRLSNVLLSATTFNWTRLAPRTDPIYLSSLSILLLSKVIMLLPQYTSAKGTCHHQLIHLQRGSTYVQESEPPQEIVGSGPSCLWYWCFHFSPASCPGALLDMTGPSRSGFEIFPGVTFHKLFEGVN